MDEENQDGSEVLETPETEAEAGEPTETVEELKAQLETERKAREDTEAKNKQLFERTKKAEAQAKAEPSTTLPLKDQLALAKADVHEDDLDEILEYAQFKKIPVTEALKAPVIKSLLQDRAEERRTASATTTKSARGTSKVSGEELLAKAERGQEIELTDENANAIFWARMARKLPKK